MKRFDVPSLMIASGLFVLSLSAFAASGNGAGNGGDAVVCVDRTKCPNDIRMLDSVNAEGAIALPASAKTLREMVGVMVSRIGEKDLYLQANLELEASKLLDDVEAFEATGAALQKHTIFGTGKLPNVADEGATFVPDGYEIQQLIVRTVDPLPDQRQYAIRNDLWSDPRMSKTEHAIAIVHESIYGYLVNKGVNLSASARWLTGLAATDLIQTYSDIDFYHLLVGYKVPQRALEWRRLRNGVYFNPFCQYADISCSTLSSTGDLLRANPAQLQTPLVLRAFEKLKISNVERITLENGAWKTLQFVAARSAAFSSHCIAYDVDSGQTFWFEDGTLSKADANTLRKTRIIQMCSPKLTRTDSGILMTNVHLLKAKSRFLKKDQLEAHPATVYLSPEGDFLSLTEVAPENTNIEK